MGKHWLWILLLLSLLLESTIMKWVLPYAWQSEVHVIPHFMVVVIIYISIYMNRRTALFYGLGFGFLQDLIHYGHALGVYSFCLGLSGYLTGFLSRRNQWSLISTLSAVGAGILFYELLVFSLYRFFLRVIILDAEWVVLYRILPSLLFNLLFALLFYMPFRWWHDRLESSESEDTD